MKRPAKMSTSELVARFIEIGIAQRIATDTLDNSRFKRLFEQKKDVVRELRLRPGDERRFLLDLYDHENFQVRLNSIATTYAMNPERAEEALRIVGEMNRAPYSSNALMSLAMLEMGLSQLPSDPWPPERVVTRKSRR